MSRRPPERRFFVLFTGFWLPVLAYVVTIFTLSAQPRLAPPLTFANADKVLHLIEYLLLGLLLVRALRASLRVARPLFAAVMAIALVVVVAAADENFQSFIPGRQCDAMDFMADSLGGGLAQLVYVVLVKE